MLLESKMLGLRQSSEFTGGALDGKVEAGIGPDEVHGPVVEEADAPLLCPLVQVIRLCHLCCRTTCPFIEAPNIEPTTPDWSRLARLPIAVRATACGRTTSRILCKPSLRETDFDLHVAEPTHRQRSQRASDSFGIHRCREEDGQATLASQASSRWTSTSRQRLPRPPEPLPQSWLGT